jgi:hypothetical protein
VEPQQIFVPSLLQLLQESGLCIVHVAGTLDPPDVVRSSPALLFCDDDALESETVRDLRFLLDSMPSLGVCLYSRITPRDGSPLDCTRLVHLEKSATDEMIRTTLARLASA